ncbi:hypothetical protein D3C81_1344560 [compost metagenome]
MLDTVLPGNFPQDGAFATVRRQDAAHNLDGGGFAGTIRADVAHQLAFGNVKTNTAERLNSCYIPHKGSLQQPPFSFGPFVHFKAFPDISKSNLHPCRLLRAEDHIIIEGREYSGAEHSLDPLLPAPGG